MINITRMIENMERYKDLKKKIADMPRFEKRRYDEVYFLWFWGRKGRGHDQILSFYMILDRDKKVTRCTKDIYTNGLTDLLDIVRDKENSDLFRILHGDQKVDK